MCIRNIDLFLLQIFFLAYHALILCMVILFTKSKIYIQTYQF